uniref:Rho guanine nucleotide exchange factor 6/7 coiled-coil domain-containing protein n=1 Tax=Meloidogyne incognita TaxID=6306 RepID=A0A914MJH0_MELIC
MIYPDGIDDVDNNVNNDENYNNNNKIYTSGLSTSENLSNNGGCFSGSSVCGNRESRPFSGLSLRPLPPRRSEWFSNNNNTSQQIKLRKGLTPEEQEDALLLKIVEGYCLSSNCLATSSINNHQHKQQQQCCPHYYRQKQRNSVESQHNYNSCGGGPIRRAASYPDKNEMATTTLTRPQLIVAENEKIFVEEMEGDQIVLKERSLVDTVYTLKDNLSALTKQVVELSKSLEQEQRSRRRLEELVRQTIPSTTSTSLIDQQTEQLEAS